MPAGSGSLPGNLRPLLGCQLLRPRLAALEATTTAQRDGGRVLAVVRRYLVLVLVRRVPDDGGGQRVQVARAFA